MNDYLYKIKREERPWCKCHTANQTVEHVIEECPLYRRQRKHHLGRYVVQDVRTILSHPQKAVKAAQFMLSTGILDQFRHFKAMLYKQFTDAE